MKNRVLGLALGASMLFGFQQLAVAAPLTAPASPAEISLGQMSTAEPVYYARRTTVVRGGNITFVIDEDDVPDAVRRLHDIFFCDLDPEVFE